MTWQGAFRVAIRVIFIFAYIAFLAASIRHVATFFHNFEDDHADWVNPYTLAVSIDLTSLILTVGVMFFRKNMPWYAQSFTWLFIVALTGFSWFVNWEYAMTYQGNDLRTGVTLRMINPILASSFAFLNLAYSIVSEFFNSKVETATELAAKVAELEELEEQQRRLAAYKERNKKEGVIQRMKNTAIEARVAVSEVLETRKESANETTSGSKTATPSTQLVEVGVTQPVAQSVTSPSTPPSTIDVTESVTPASPFVTLDSIGLEENSDAVSDTWSDVASRSTSDAVSDIYSVTGLEYDSDALSDTGDHERVEVPVTPQPRITVDLSDASRVTERNTDKLNKSPKRVKPAAPKMTELEKRIRRFIARYPDLNDTQIAMKAPSSRSYVAKVRARMLEESQELAEVSA